MDYVAALSITNDSTQPMVVWVEPLGEDYTLLPNDVLTILRSAQEVQSQEYRQPFVAWSVDSVSVSDFGDYEVHCNGKPVGSGHQRQPDGRPMVRLEAVLSASPKDIYELWFDAETLSEVFGSPVEKVNNKQQFESKFLAYEKSIEWTTIMKTPYSELYQLWRSSDFPGTAPNSHVKIVLEEQEGSTRILITHEYLPVSPQKNWEEVWRIYFLGPMQKYFENK